MDYIKDERRDFRRVKFSEPVQLRFKDPKQFGGCLSCDLSESGIRLNLTEFVPIGTEVSVEIQLSDKKIVECYGRIVWIVKLPFSERYQAGMEFSKEDSIFESRYKIHKFLQSYSDVR